MDEYDDLLKGKLIKLDVLCKALGVEPSLQDGEAVSWIQQDPLMGTGINAELRLYTKDMGEPFDCSLGVHESFCIDEKRNDWESSLYAIIEFVRDEDIPDLLEVSNTQFGYQELQSIDQLEDVLKEVNVVLSRWKQRRFAPA